MDDKYYKEITIIWYEENGEFKYRTVQYPSEITLKDKFARYERGLTNRNVHLGEPIVRTAMDIYDVLVGD